MNSEEIKCYFSRINENRDTLEMDYSEIKTSNRYRENEDQDPNQSFKNVKFNTKVKIAKDGKTLEFTTNGGMTMEVNTEINIKRIFPLKEGILLEFVAKEKYNISEIFKKIRKSPKTEMEEEQLDDNPELKNLSYVTLNYHPYDIFRPIQIVDNKTSKVWVDLPLKIVFIEPLSSICIFYNTETKTHKIAILNILYEGISLTENQVTPFISNPIYSLGGEALFEKKSNIDIRANESCVKAIILLKDETQEEMAKKCCLIESYKYYRHNLQHHQHEFIKEFLLYIQCRNYAKIYSIEMRYDSMQGKGNKFVIGKVRQSGCVSSVVGMTSVKLLNFKDSFFDFAEYTESGLEEEKFLVNSGNDYHSISSNLDDDGGNLGFSDLKDWVYYKANTEILKKNIFHDAVIVMDFERGLSLHMGMKDVFHFTIDKNISRRLKEDENWEFVSIVNNQLVLRCFTHNSERFIFCPSAYPQIDSPYILSILQLALTVFDYTTFKELVKDLMYNCLDFDYNFKPMLSEGIEHCNFKEYSQDQFKRLTYYFCYLLQIGSKDDFNNENLEKILDNGPIKFTKKFKGNNLEEEGFNIDPKEAWMSLQNDAFTDPDLRDLEKYFPDIEINYQKSTPKENSGSMNLNRVLPRTNINSGIFSQYKVKFFKYAHLLLEDLKLNNLMEEARNKFSYFLYCYAYFLGDINSANYLEYYTRDNSNLAFEFKLDEPIQFFKVMFDTENSLLNVKGSLEKELSVVPENENFSNNNLEETPYDLQKAITKIVSQKKKIKKYYSGNSVIGQNEDNQVGKFPLLYKTSYFVMKIFSLYFLGEEKPYFNGIKQTNLMANRTLHKSYSVCFPISRACFHKDENSVLNVKSKCYHSLMQLSRKVRIRISNEIFIYMIKKRVNKRFVNSLSSSCERIMGQIIGQINQNLPEFVYRSPIPKRAYELIGREDIYMNKKLYPKVKNHTKRVSHHRRSLSKSSLIFGTPSFISDTPNSIAEEARHFDSAHSAFKINEKEESRITGVKQIIDHQILSILNINLHYKERDSVYKETFKLLDIKSNMKIKSNLIRDIQDSELNYEIQKYGKMLSIRRLSVLVGKGAFNINTDKSILTDVLQIPKIKLSCILAKDSRKVNFEAAIEEQHSMNWPHFHNSVAVGLELSREIVNNIDSETVRTWIRYQNIGDGESNKYENFGLFLGFGLHGLLKCFFETDMYRYLKEYNEMRSIGLLLGLAASKIGTKDLKAKNAFCIHLNCTRGPGTDLKMSQLLESCALLSLGLLYTGSCKRQQSDLMLSQIAASPQEEKNPYRECYSLSAGFALGLINLGRGNNIPAKNEMSLDERLLNYVNGGRKFRQKHPYLNTIEDNYKSSNIKEGTFVNTQLTAPSALMALALIYMKTEKSSIATSLKIPSTLYEVENCNLNHILLKVLTKNMIMWKKIKPSEDYIESQIPPIIRILTKSSHSKIAKKFENTHNLNEIDYSGIALIYYNCIAGAVMALALKFSGSGNEKVKSLILSYLKKIQKVHTISNNFVCDPSHKGKIDIYNYFNVLCVCMLSLSLVMAGTADIECLKAARIIRKLLEQKMKMHYGFNMAVHMAVGFLSLGKGGYTFGREDLHIAALLLSVYPHFPTNPDDNRYHLQAFRHFYAMAIVPNLFHAIDIDSKESAVVNFQIYSNGHAEPKKFMTPAYLQGVEKWKRVKLDNKDYFHNDFTFDKIDENSPPRMLFIKKKYDKRIDIKRLEKALHIYKYDQKIPENEINKIFRDYYFGDLFKLFMKQRGNGMYLDEEQLLFLFPKNSKNKKLFKMISSQMEENKENHESEKKKTDNVGSLMMNIFHSLLKQGKLSFLEDNLEFVFNSSDIGTKPFSKINNLNSKESQVFDNYMMMYNLFKNHYEDSKSKYEVKEIEMRNIKTFLDTKMKFSDKEILVLKKMGLRMTQSWDLTTDLTTKSQYRSFMNKLKYHSVPLSRVFSEVVNIVDTGRQMLKRRDSDLDDEVFWKAVKSNDFVRLSGLGDLVQQVLK